MGGFYQSAAGGHEKAADVSIGGSL